ncbi:transposase [Nonomuraea polychroma]|uniref:transposase n=1 Tax=Nonomuraea polychroma TaxID=46176 RepID=UPI003D933F30
MSFVLTPGQAGDSPQFRAVPETRQGPPARRPPAQPPGRGGADKAYSSRSNRAYLRRRRIKAVIPEKSDQATHRKKRGSRGGRPVSHDPDLYKERNTAELCINRIKEWRGLAFRFDKTPDSYLAGLHPRGAILWIRSLHPI